MWNKIRGNTKKECLKMSKSSPVVCIEGWWKVTILVLSRRQETIREQMSWRGSPGHKCNSLGPAQQRTVAKEGLQEDKRAQQQGLGWTDGLPGRALSSVKRVTQKTGRNNDYLHNYFCNVWSKGFHLQRSHLDVFSEVRRPGRGARGQFSITEKQFCVFRRQTENWD